MKYRKRPIVIEASRWDGTEEDAATIVAWINSNSEGDRVVAEEGAGILTGEYKIFINTKEGTMAADPNDWIIQGVQGEFYPCKPDIFEATYEAAE